TNELPTRIADGLREALDTSELEASVAVSVSTGIPPAAVPIGSLGIEDVGSLSSFLGLEGAPSPTLDLTGSLTVIPIDQLLGLVGGAIEELIFPIVGTAVEGVLNLDDLVAEIGSIATAAVSELEPLLDLVNNIVSIVVNVQEDPGTFANPDGHDS